MAKHATKRETLKIGDLLREHLTIITEMTDDEPGLVKYEDGWSDLRVAREISPTMSKHSVAGVRSDCFGNLLQRTAPPVPAVPSELTDEVYLIRQDLNHAMIDNHDLKGQVHTLTERLNGLLMALHMKGHADTKHLMIRAKDNSYPGVASAPKNGHVQ